MKNLSKKEMKFVLSRLEGNTMEAAYAEGYPGSKKWTRASREKEANEVMRRPHVKAFYDKEYERLKKEAAETARKKAIWNREKSLKALSFIVETGLEELKVRKNIDRKNIDCDSQQSLNPAIANSVIRAIAELNRMDDGSFDNEQKSIARQLVDLNPDDIDERPEDYAVSVKQALMNNNGE